MRTSFNIFLAFILFLSISGTAFSQDTLYMHNGNTIAAKVVEVGTDEVKYKRFDNLEGPVFIVKNTEINTIKYKNGVTDQISKPVPPVAAVIPAPVDPNPPIYRRGLFYKQGYTRLKAKEMHRIVLKMNDAEINYHVKKAKFAKGMEYVGYVAIPSLAFALGYTGVTLINNNIDGGDMSYGPGIASGILAAAALTTSITFKFSGKKHNDAALKIYNEKY